ncbi:MAG TPA: ATP-binding cassette domain-containing protein [Candidatus Mcinerneyibacteriales bacterium]|nr:ATP-binding cassette domain-containing protein [Candidatus Mcinerneyibacteriales bacterium]
MIRFENAGVSFGDFRALDSLSLTIEQGEFVALIGPNGSGKSTFVRLINGLLLPTEGRVTVEGLDTARDDLFEIRKKAAALFQNPDNQIVAATVEDEVAFGPENLMLPAREIEKRIDDALSFVDMLQYRQHLTANLSGGQKQRVAFASIIAMEAPVYLFDEPTSLIDVQGRKKVLEIIRRIHEKGKTVVLVSHFLEEVFLARRIIVLHEGKILFDGTPRDLLYRKDVLGILEFPLPAHLETARRLHLDPEILDLKNIAQALRRRLG